MLGAMFAAAPAVQAGTITYGETVRTAGAGGQLRPAIDVRLRIATQGQPTAQVGVAQSGSAASREQQEAAGQQSQAPSGSTNVSSTAPADPTLTQSGGKVETVDLGDVTGTVCDCGEIPVIPEAAKRGFPWWVFGGIPLICVSGICTGDDTPDTPNKPNPTPTPTNNPTPEPMSLLLFGSGLLAVGAGARRRYGRRRDEELNLSATTEEV